MKWSNFLFFSSVVISCPTYANDPFAELDQEMAVYDDRSGDSVALEKEFQAFLIEQEKQYQAWLVAYLKEFDQFQQTLVSKWGKGMFLSQIETLNLVMTKM
ncbi:hypothetical protein [Psychromonas sp. MME2]|uniref:hypothetical protein n=1 Tax=Psychromonas sp. MME2 TaxID=3231033 RepID=UPI00339BD7AF